MAEQSLKSRIHEIIFEADTPAGKAFDIALLIAILLSVIAVMLESVSFIPEIPFIKENDLFFYLEWGLTILFLLEYILRIYSVNKPFRYIFSFYGIVDLLAILPSFIDPFVSGTQYLVTVRALRLLRVFRVLKLTNYLSQSRVITAALIASRAKITVFLIAVSILVVMVGTVMYLVEGGEGSDFTSIPRSIYWAIVTVTTVGYGDIAPVTPLGQLLSAILMIMGYGIIAVPTGIVSVELSNATDQHEKLNNTIACPDCGREGHDSDAVHCKYCGGKL